MSNLTIIVRDAYAQPLQPTILQRSVIKNATSAKAPGYFHSPKYKAKKWDGNVYLYNKIFPIGLLPTVLEDLEEFNQQVFLKDERSLPELNNDLTVTGFEPRDYQLEAAKVALEKQLCTLGLSTNAGKTLIAALLIKAVGYKAVIIVPKKFLVIQTAEKLTKMLGIPIGRFGAGYHEIFEVTVTTMASLKTLVEEHSHELEDNRLLVVDECHHTKAKQIFDNIFKIPGPYRIGMSGTPLNRSELADMKLIGATGPIAYTISNKQLIALGVSSKVAVKFTTMEGSDDMWMKPYHEAYKSLIVGNEIRNMWIANMAEKERKRGPVLIIVNWVEHAENLEKMFKEVNVLTGKDTAKKVSGTIDKVVSNSGIMIATTIFDEGVDIPEITTVIIAAGGKDHKKLLQRIGRGIRVTDDDATLHIYDFIDTENRYLLSHSEDRYKVVKEEGFPIELI